MNYIIHIIGLDRRTIDLVVKLFIHSAREADYIVSVEGAFPENIFDAIMYKVFLKGSEKNNVCKIVVDFDNVCITDDVDISPNKLLINIDKNLYHYWYLLGILFKRVDDLSTGFVAGYLIENRMEQELKSFRSA
ncbi:MAG: hypothetical protein N3C60_08625 [Calditerrivibrio sp.]|nr:hypothetical protein [Calditerrivibrio sp.]